MGSMKQYAVWNNLKFFLRRVAALSLAAASMALPLCGCTAQQAETDNLMLLSEVVSSNRYNFSTPAGNSPDWVELYNPTGETIQLKGWGLTDDMADPHKFTFPDVSLSPGEYLVVYCTGPDQVEEAFLCAEFKISAAGETLALTTDEGHTLQILSVPALETDISYGILDGAYTYFLNPSPGEPNGGETSETGDFSSVTVQSDFVINEFMADNRYSLQSADQNRYAWVEIKNTSSEAQPLTGYGLSDSALTTKKWSFPDLTLSPQQSVVVFLSGLETAPEGELHASFSLSANDEVLVLSNARGKAVDIVDVEQTGGGISKGRSPEGAIVYYPISTPGVDNTTPAFSTLDEAQTYLPDVYISEVKTCGEDWIELHNASQEAVDLTGWRLSDDKDNLPLYQFEATTLAPGGYLVVENMAFALDRYQDTVYLANSANIVVHHLRTGVQSSTISRGCLPGSAQAYYFSTHTKGAANPQEGYAAYAAAPTFSVDDIYVEAGVSVALSAPEGCTIHYTTNGTAPTTASTQYTGPITVSQNTVLRAISAAPGMLTSTVATHTYLTESLHTLPVVCVSMNPDDFSSEATGIYARGAGYYEEDFDGSDFAHTRANYWQDWERAANITWYEADGELGVSFDAGISIHGQFSRENAKKSFNIKLRSDYGQSEITYPFFRDCDVTTFTTLILRSSGQDWDDTILKDAFIHQAVKGQMDVDIMDCRPCVVYINGEYWGIYNLREKQNEDHVLSYNPDAVKGAVDIIKGNDNVRAGDTTAWLDLRAYIKARLPEGGKPNQMNNADVMAYIDERVNIKSLQEWMMAEIFFANTDTGNVRRYTYDGGEWYWMLFDLDWALQTGAASRPNYLAELFNSDGHGTNNNFFSHMQQAIYNCDEWRNEFIRLYAQHLNTTFSVARLHRILDQMAAEIRPEMERNVARWGAPASVDAWEQKISDMKDTISLRWSAAVNELKTYFNLSDVQMKELFPNGY